MSAVRRSAALSIFWMVHRWVYRISGGRVGSRLYGNQIINLTTIGRKSGQAHSVLLYAFLVKDDYFVVGSNAGADTHSHWFLNLQTNPVVAVEVSRKRYEALARITHGDERKRLWAEAVAANPSYAEYRERTERVIPVIVLEPHDIPVHDALSPGQP